MGKAKAAAKQSKASAMASTRASGGKSATQATTSSVSTLLQPLVTPVLLVLSTYLLFAFFLPFLANLTPPGVDPKAVADAVEAKIALAARGCEDSCRGLSCPSGWTTARDKHDVCKCICVRIDPTIKTAWDLERARKEQDAEQQAQRDAAARLEAMSNQHSQQPQQPLEQAQQQPPEQQPPEQQPSEQPQQQQASSAAAADS